MKIEAGKKYVCKNRPDVDYVKIERWISTMQQWRGIAHYNDGHTNAVGFWPEDGQSRSFDDWSLVAEWVDPMQGIDLTTSSEGSGLSMIINKKERCTHEKIVNLSFMHIKMGCAACGKLEEEIKAEKSKECLKSWGL